MRARLPASIFLTQTQDRARPEEQFPVLHDAQVRFQRMQNGHLECGFRKGRQSHVGRCYAHLAEQFLRNPFLERYEFEH